MAESKKIFITGGSGYVGSMLVPELLKEGHKVTVYDLMMYGKNLKNHENLKPIKGDIRDAYELAKSMEGHDIVIHLACISNDPSYELNPNLSKSINLIGSINVINAAETVGIKRFINASSSSVYGIKEEEHVTEKIKPSPITDYSIYKLEVEKFLAGSNMEWVTLRPATICGYAPRLRLDTVVNILTAHALVNNKILIFGGEQYRAHLNIEDMVRAYIKCIDAPKELIDKEIFNVSFINTKVSELANLVKGTVGGDIELQVVPTNDPRSYRVDGQKFMKKVGFTPIFGLGRAIESIQKAYRKGLIKDALNNPLYHNVKMMKEINLR